MKYYPQIHIYSYFLFFCELIAYKLIVFSGLLMLSSFFFFFFWEGIVVGFLVIYFIIIIKYYNLYELNMYATSLTILSHSVQKEICFTV